MFIVQFHPWAKIVSSNDGVWNKIKAIFLEDINRQHSTDSETPAVVSPVTELEDGEEDPVSIPHDAAEENVKPPAEKEGDIIREILGDVGDETVSDETENDLQL